MKTKLTASVILPRPHDWNDWADYAALKVQWRRAFEKSELCRSLQDCRISYYLERLSPSFDNQIKKGWLVFNVDEENEMMLRLILPDVIPF